MATLRAFLLRLVAALTLAVLLLGPPLVVTRIVPDPVPTSAQLSLLRNSGSLDTDLALRLGALLFYLLWAWLAIVALVEVGRVLGARSGAQRGVRDSRALLPPDHGSWMPTSLVRRLVRLALLASLTTGPLLAPTTAAAFARPVGISTPLGGPSASAAAGATISPVTLVEARAVTHLSTGRDTALSLAIDVFHDEGRRGEIVELNLGRPTPEGTDWSSGVFPAGMAVLLPADAPTTNPAPAADPSPVDFSVPAVIGSAAALAAVAPTATSTATPAGASAAGPAVRPDDDVVVAPGDNLWRLSQARLDAADGADGAPDDHRIYDYVVEVEQRNDFASGNPSLIFPGEHVRMPSLARAADSDGPTSTSTAVTPAVAPAPDPAVAPVDAPGPPLDASTAGAVTSPGAVTSRSATDTTAERTTAERVDGAAAVPDSPPAAGDVFSWLADQTSHLGPATTPPVAPPADDESRSAKQLGAVGAAAILAGLVTFGVRRRRARCALQREPGERLVLPSITADETELALRRLGRDDAVAWAWLALRSIGAEFAGQPDPPVPTHLTVGADGLAAHFDRPAPAPTTPVFEAVDAASWRVSTTVSFDELAHLARDGREPCPFLVPLGNTADGALLVNLEAFGTLAVVGPPWRQRAVLTALTLGLAAGPWAREIDVRVLGGPPFDTFDHVAVATAEQLDALARQVAAARVHERPETNPLARRLRAGGDDWVGSAIVAYGRADVSSVAGIATPGGGVVLLAAGDRELPGAARLVVAADGTARFEPLGIELTSTVGLDDDDADELTRIFEIRSVRPDDARPADAPGDRPDDAPGDRPGDTEIDDARRAAPLAEATLIEPTSIGEPIPGLNGPTVHQGTVVEVRVLDDAPMVLVDGAGPLSPAATAIVVNLALRGPSPTSAVRQEVYGTDGITDEAFRAVVARVRSVLGLDRTGVANLPSEADGQLRLGPRVVLDLERFEQAAMVAHLAAGPGGPLAAYRTVLQLVTGRPFTDVAGRYYRWLDLPPARERERVATAIADASYRAATLALDAGDPDAAEDLARIGLRSGAGNEALARVLARARDEQGDTDDGLAVLEAVGSALRGCDPMAEPAPLTLALEAELSQRSLLQRTA